MKWGWSPLLIAALALLGYAYEWPIWILAILLGVILIVGLILLKNIYIIIAMAFTATIVETFISELDDNLFVPLFAGFVGQLLFFLI